MPSWDTLLVNTICVSGDSFFFLVLYNKWNKSSSLVNVFTFGSVHCHVGVLISLMSSQVARRRMRRSESTSWRTSPWISGTALSGCATAILWVPPQKFFSRRRVIVDIRASTNGTFGLFDPQGRLKPAYIEELSGKLKQFSGFLGDRKWFAGDKVCVCVCCMNSVVAVYWCVFSFFFPFLPTDHFCGLHYVRAVGPAQDVSFFLPGWLCQSQRSHEQIWGECMQLMQTWKMSVSDHVLFVSGSACVLNAQELVSRLCYFRLWKKLLPTWSPTDSSRLLSTTRWPNGETKKSNCQIASSSGSSQTSLLWNISFKSNFLHQKNKSTFAFWRWEETLFLLKALKFCLTLILCDAYKKHN